MYCRCHYRRSFNGQEPVANENARHFAGMDDEQQRQTARKGGETSAREQQRDSRASSMVRVAPAARAIKARVATRAPGPQASRVARAKRARAIVKLWQSRRLQQVVSPQEGRSVGAPLSVRGLSSQGDSVGAAGDPPRRGEARSSGVATSTWSALTPSSAAILRRAASAIAAGPEPSNSSQGNSLPAADRGRPGTEAWLHVLRPCGPP